MDVEDDSIQGVMKYLVYRRRKALEFQKEMLMLKYTGGTVYNPDSAIEELTRQWYPENPEYKMIEIAEKSKEMTQEAQKTFSFVIQDGKKKLKIG